MNVYDFDGTIYKNDSSLKFYFFCLRRKPILSLCFIKQGFAMFLYLANVYSKTKMKEAFFCYLKYIKDIDICIGEFWGKEIENIQPWYLSQQLRNDAIVSASPEFLIKPIADELGILNVIASRIDKKSGRYEGLNCFGIEKVERFREAFPDETIDAFYTDSKSDKPLAAEAKKAFLVQSEKIVKWDDVFPKESVNISILEILRYGFWGGITTCLNLLIFHIFLKLNINYLLANITSYFIAVFFSYFFNKIFVFEQRKEKEGAQIAKFFLIRLVSISLDSGLLFLAVDGMHANILISKIIISFLIILGTYWANKQYVF